VFQNLETIGTKGVVTITSILKNTELDNEDITSIIFKFDQSNNLKFIIDVLSNNL